METSYFKLNAKKRMMKNHFKCFIVSVFPFMAVVLLVIFNYFLVRLLNDVTFNTILLPYAMYIRLLVLTTSIILSTFIWKSVQLVVDGYFLSKVHSKNVTLGQTIKCITFGQCLTFFMVSIVRFFLSVSWFVFYLSPCIAVSCLLLYSYKYENNGFNINLTLFISAILLFIIGVVFFYVTLKRYAMCSSVILTGEEKNPLKVIVKSIEIMENHSVQYAFYCLSFLGWILLCLLIIPIIYVVPYFKMSKSCFRNSLGLPKRIEQNEEKPIVFYFPKRAPN